MYRYKDVNLKEVKKPSKDVLAKLHSLTEKKGRIAVIEPESGEYFLGKTLTEAIKKAKAAYPGKVFYSIRIGYSFVHEHKGGMKRL